MFVKPCVGIGDQLFIETPLIRTAFIAAYQQNRRAFCIKCKSQQSYTTVVIETKLLHISVLRAFERIHSWPAQVGAEFLKELGVGEQFILECTIKRLKLSVKFIVKYNVPRHKLIMYLTTYSGKVRNILHSLSIGSKCEMRACEKTD